MQLAKLIICIAAVVLSSACSQRKLEVFESVSGENAAEQFGVSLYSNFHEMDASWIRQALGKSKYENLRSKVDFKRQSILVAAVGHRPHFSGVVRISRVYQYTGVDDWPVNASVSVGTSKHPCEFHTNAFPFIVAIIEKPERDSTISGMDFQNFPDECKVQR